jgi:hypothetical protein
MLLIRCVTTTNPAQVFYLSFSDCPHLNETIEIENKQWVVLKVTKHTGLSRQLPVGNENFPIYMILSTTIVLSERN